MVTVIRPLPKRSFTLAAGTIVFALALLALVGSSTPALATSGGYAYDVPLVDDVDPDPTVVETTIVADEATVVIGNGVTANVQAFNSAEIPQPSFYLLRPDGHVGLAGTTLDSSAVLRYLTRRTGCFETTGSGAEPRMAGATS